VIYAGQPSAIFRAVPFPTTRLFSSLLYRCSHQASNPGTQKAQHLLRSVRAWGAAIG